MASMKEICSVSDFISNLRTLRENSTETIRFFRGHGDSGYKLEPSIYRHPSWIENENRIINDALVNCPFDFESNPTNFDKLVKLQHYGYPTRLLDLTNNALVALYFAVSSGADTDGEIIIFDIPNESVKYENSDTVSILAALGFCDINLKKYLDWKIQAEKKSKIYRDILLKLDSSDKSNQNILLMMQIFENLSVAGLSDNEKISGYALDKYLVPRKKIEIFNKFNEIAKLIHTIRMDKSYFQPIIDPDDLVKVIAVRAKFNKPRIIRQQGSFLIFGIGQNKSEQAQIPQDWIKTKNQKFIIKKNAKSKILQELKYFGITKQTLFPELEAQADDIKNAYK